jgi:hypothetical protein
MINTLTLLDFLKLFIGITTILGFVYKLLFDFKKLKEAYCLFKKEVCQVRFPEIVLYGIFSAFLGGLFYNLVFHGNLGGTGQEPHGLSALFWGATANVFSFLILILINKRISNIPWRRQIFIYGAFLLGITLGGWTYYDLPLAGHVGFRSLIENKLNGCIGVEGMIALLWSGIIGTFGFAFLYIAKLCFGQKYEMNFSFAGLVMAIITTIIVTTLAIMCFVVVFPCLPQFNSARGIIAAVALRTTLFVNAVNSQFLGQKVE